MSSKFAVCVYFDESFAEIKNIVEPVNKKYFNKYDIEYIVKQGTQKEHNQVPYYHKFGLLQKTLHKRRDLEYVFMMDADIAILNHDLDIRVFTTMTDKPIMMCTTTDGTGDMYWNINSGAIIVKNTEEARKFINSYMDAAESQEYEVNDQPLLQNILANYNTGLVAVYPKYAFNHALEGSFLYHVCDDSTTNQDFDSAIYKKIESLKTAIKNANII